MKQLIAITPADIEAQITPMEVFVVQMAVTKINAELMNRRYTGPEPFRTYLADHLTEGAIKEIVKPFKAHWKNPRVEQRSDGMYPNEYWFILESMDT